MDNAHHRSSETESEVATNSQEADDIEKERKVETDDPESLRKAREFDEYKDGTYFDYSFPWLQKHFSARNRFSTAFDHLNLCKY